MAAFFSQISLCMFLYLLSVATPTKTKSQRIPSLFAPRNGRLPHSRCINLGSRCESDRTFEAEADLVKYRNPQPGFCSLPSVRLNGTRFNQAFVTQRMGDLISFVLKVDRRFNYKVTLGFAELSNDTCKPGARVMNLNVQGTSKFGVDVFKAVGCRKPYRVAFLNVKPGSLGFLSGFVRGVNSMAQVATICVERGARRTPGQHPKPSMGTLLKESKCRQKDCFTFDGRGDYVLIGNSHSRSEDRRDCTHFKSSSATLNIPAGAKVKKAILYWSASGQLKQKATTSLNGVFVKANRTYRSGYQNVYRFYGAWADVTSIVQKKGLYEVGNIWLDNAEPYCFFNSAYAAWSLAVIYERSNLLSARLNLCVDDFTFTYPAGVYTNHVRCISGSRSTLVARTSLVTFESDNYKGEHFSINGRYLGDNLFNGSTAPNLDIRSFDILSIVRTGVPFISYTVQSYFTQTPFGGATEGLFVPMRVVYHTLE